MARDEPLLGKRDFLWIIEETAITESGFRRTITDHPLCFPAIKPRNLRVFPVLFWEIPPILMKIDIEKLVSHTAFFQGISESGHRLLASICIPKKILKKEILFHQEERGHSIFLLAMGSIRLSKFTPSGEEVVIKVLGLHEVFAEVILFEEELYPVTATALTESVVLQIPKREVLQLLNKESFRNDFIRLLMKKQRYLADQIHLLRSADVQTRFFHFLRDQYGDREEIPMTISKKDVAAAIGTTPETLSRLLQCLKKKRQLVWSGSAIRVSPGFWSRTPASF